MKNHLNTLNNQLGIFTEYAICSFIVVLCLLFAYILKERKYVATLDLKGKIFFYTSMLFAFILISTFAKITLDLFLIYF